MFDPRYWTSEIFDRNTLVAIGNRQVITMAPPAGVVIALTAIYWDNTDSVTHNLRLRARPIGAGEFATMHTKSIAPASAGMILPEQTFPAQPIVSALATPLFFSGPLEVALDDLTSANVAHTPRIMIRWMQLKADGKVRPINVVISVL